MKPQVLLRLPAHVPERARFPAIDAHNHLFADLPAERILQAMDAAGVRVFLNVSGNVSLPFDEKGYTIRRRPFADFAGGYLRRYPGRFAAFTMSDFARWDDFSLFRSAENPDGDPARFAELALRHLEEDAAQGALGLKVTKELGLQFRDNDGSMIPVDDPRLFPVWKRAGELKLPVLIHTADPSGFFLPVDEGNEHYPTLQEYPGWSFHGSVFSKQELLAQRDRMIGAHPGTTFICPHVASQDEDLAAASRFLDEHPNAFIDFSARIDELGRQPYTARDFFLRYRERILFGSDMPPDPQIYRCYFRFLETRDEHFDYPDYTGRWGTSRWKIYGLHLPDEVLRRVYYENALRVIPGLEEIYAKGRE